MSTPAAGEFPDFAKVERDLSFLLGCFVEVLTENGETELAARLPWQQADDEDGAALPPRARGAPWC